MYGLYRRTVEAGRHRQADGGREYRRGEEVKSVWNNDDRSVIDNDRTRR